MTYAEVVKKAKKEIEERLKKPDVYGNSNVRYVKCDTWMESSQINLWTYWQGYQIKDVDKGVDIMLVGQDWGPVEGNDKVFERIKRIEKGEDETYYCKSNSSPTDDNLVTLFKECLGLDITDRKTKKRLFFTNYSLGYRYKNGSGGMTKTLMRQDKELFDELVEAIKPKIIICLGKITYEAATDTVVKGFVETLKKGKPLIQKRHIDSIKKDIKVYGVPHCGTFGTNNVGGMKKMEEIWKFIASDDKK